MNRGEVGLEISNRIDGLAPQVIHQPCNSDDAAGIVKESILSRMPLVPMGGCTAIHTGNPLQAEKYEALSSCRLNYLVDYSPEDLVVTAAAGMRLSELQAVLNPHNQWIPIDPSQPEQCTLGGIVARNATGALRSGYGSVRDRLLGVNLVTGTSKLSRLGGRVVKNVAGYETAKLICGSWGTLGFITEVTLKTQPLPAAKSSICMKFDSSPKAMNAALEVHRAMLGPVRFLVATHPSGASIDLEYHGSEKAVSWCRATAADILAKGGGREGMPDIGPDNPNVELELRTTVLQVPELANQCADLPLQWQASFDTGIVSINISSSDRPRLLQIIRFVASFGHVIALRIPSEWKAGVDVWGGARNGHPLMTGIKQVLDPHSLFSPGRFIGGI